ncbi:MAG: DUF4191 domain-containing protein [Antricoccus sp.]
MAKQKPDTGTSAPSAKATTKTSALFKGAKDAKGKNLEGKNAQSKDAHGKSAGAKNPQGKKKAPKVKKQRFSRTREIFQAYKMLKPQDPKLGLWIGLTVGGTLVVVLGLFLIFISPWWLGIVPAILIAVLTGLLIFSYRARRTTFAQAEGKPGAASWAMKQLRGDWRITDGVLGNSQSDLVHRVIGRPGIVLVAEGNPVRVKSLLSQEKKRLARVVGDTPIYDVQVGDGDGQIPLKKLNSHLTKLPRNIQGAQIRALEKRLQAVGAPKMPMPQGPLPKGRQMAVNSRQLRRRS